VDLIRGTKSTSLCPDRGQSLNQGDSGPHCQHPYLWHVNQSSSATENRKIHIGPITQAVAAVGCATGGHNPFFYDVDVASSSCTTSNPTVCRSRSLCHELRLQVFNDLYLYHHPLDLAPYPILTQITTQS
jgi:hypothetical protein